MKNLWVDCLKTPGILIPTNFDFLGFRHFWATSRQGRPVVKRKTIPSRFGRAVRRLRDYCRQHRHDPLPAQHEGMSRRLRGHYQFYGIIGNARGLGRFFYEARRAWQYWLNRRAQRRRMPWHRFARLLRQYPLPPPLLASAYRRVAKP